jgi:hypothetical protein
MDNGSPALEVGLDIVTGNSLGEVAQLKRAMAETEGQIVRQAGNIERATDGMVKLAPAIAEVRTFGSESTRAAAAAERAAERMTFALEKEIATYGKSRAEIRGMRAEQKAAAADALGMTDAANRLRAANAARNEQEAAAARRAAAEIEALAGEQARAALQTAAAREQEARALRGATVAYNMFEAAASRGMAAYRAEQALNAAAEKERQAQAVRSAASAYEMFEARVRQGVAAMKAEQDVARQNALAEREQQLRSASLAYDMFEAKARSAATAMREADAAAASDAAALANLRAMIDPAGAAQDRLNAELAEARRLMTAAGASAQELAAAEDALWDRSRRATAGHLDMANAANKSGGALRNVALQLPDITQGLLTGQPPMTVFIQQGFQIVQVAQMAEGGLRGFGRELGGLALRFAPVLVAVAAAGAGFALFNRWVNEGVKNEQLTSGLGKITGGADATKQELFKLKDATITWADTSKALFSVVGKDVAAAFVGDMKGMGKDVKSTLDDLTSYGRVALASLYAGVAGMKAYMGEISSREGLVRLLTGDPTLNERTFGKAYEQADAYLTKLGGRVKKAALANARERIADGIGYNNIPKPKIDRHAETLERDARAVEAQITGLYRLADAYGVSGAAALIAEAQVKAETAAIRKRGDVDEFVNRQVRLAIADRVKTAAQGAAGMRDQAAMQAEVSAAVADGLVPASRADELMRARMAELPLLAAIEAAQQRGLTEEAKRATKALDDQRDAQRRADAADVGKRFFADQSVSKERLADLTTELGLVGATDAVRTRTLATIRATREAEAKGYTGAYAKSYIDDQVTIAAGTEQLATAQRSWNDELTWTADRLDLIAANVANAGRGMADAFGDAGRAIGDLATIYTGFEANRARLDAERKRRILDANGNERDIARANERFALQSATAQIGAFGDMASAAKGFFNEKSKGYAIITGAEKAFRAVEFALSVRSVAQDAVETGTSIANTVARTAVSATEAVVNAIKGLPFPLNLAAGAAPVAAIASLGVSVVGGFGGGGNKLPASNTGTGTVLGDRDAKSDSIRRAIDGLKDVDLLMLSSSRQMAASLRSIDNAIGGVAALVVRAGDVNASATVTEGFKTNAVGSVLKAIVPVFGGALASLFGTKTTVVGSGLYGGAQSLGSVLDGGFDASYYSDVQKKKKLFGITTSTKYSTQYTGADASLENQFTLILRNFNSAIVAAAGPLGEATDAIQNRLNGFVVNLGKIDLQGLTGTEIQEKLTAVFGAAADNMALAAFPGFERFQKVGEGAFETLVRVASTVEAVSASLDLLGTSAQTMGLDAKLGLADRFDGISDLTSAADAYFQAFYSREEQAAAKTAQFAKVFDGLGAAMPATLDGFRNLVEAQDLTTEAGQSTYATLLQLAPAFADLKSAMDGAKSAADILAERQDLQRKVLELNGDTAAIRALDLVKIDVSNRALQEQVWAIEDAQKAAQAAEQLADAWSSVGDSINDEIKRIRGLNASGGNSFAVLQGQFNAANTAARGGDMDAAKLLPSLSQALLKSAGDNATSRQELDRVQSQTAANLEATSIVIAALAKGNPLTASGSVAVAAMAAQTATPTTTAANDSAADELRQLREEVAGMRRDNNSGHAASASAGQRAARVLEDVTAASGGDAISVANAA